MSLRHHEGAHSPGGRGGGKKKTGRTQRRTSRYVRRELRQKDWSKGTNKHGGLITWMRWMAEQRPQQCSLTAPKAADLCPLVTHFNKKVVSKVHWWGLQFYPFLSFFQEQNTLLIPATPGGSCEERSGGTIVFVFWNGNPQGIKGPNLRLIF